ncbi:hypothetical protein [Granulicella sp. dw_53]|uniref:hypothetical protein n=1 Tax=Granulicella sp. dw_53 TaxID=2719792 RepID=UPI001BD35E39|nr:hypothetical protein [Granulicella sp. dw_53]
MNRRLLVISGLALLTQVGMAQRLASHKLEPLSDSQLDRVTAGGVSASMGNNGVINFQGSAATSNGLVEASGNMRQLTSPISTTNMGSINLTDGAQSGLSALNNIVAVNSAVQVLVNLNVSIGSTIGTIIQTNMGGKH